MSKLEAALALAAKGFLVFPIKPNCKSPPLIKGWPEKATTDVVTIRRWWDNWHDANIGIHCKGMIVIDVDPGSGGAESFQILEAIYDLPATFGVRTPTGGRHVYYSAAAPVANSVCALGEGLDIRSDSGYVVAPGSVVHAGAYSLESDLPITSAPDWLVQKLGTFAKREKPTDLNVPDADCDAVQRAVQWLRTAERSVKGQGGDQAAYRVACQLRDFGLSYWQASTLMRSEAWDFGCGWRGGWLEEKPVASAYRYATGEPGAKIVQGADFPVVKTRESSVNSDSAQNNRLLTLEQFANSERAQAGYVVKGLLQRASYAEVFGAPGEGKTFVALDLAYHVAAGTAWMERKVRGGPVLYLAFEGVGGLVGRAQALRQRYGQAKVPLYVAGAALSLRDAAGRAELGRLLAQLPDKPALVVIDTLARALMGGDENSAQDVGAFNSAVAALIESTGACVVIVHHSGKDASKGARGSSALLGALDTEIQIQGGQIISKKQRDVEIAAPIGFKLTPVVVGMDSDGDALTSCIVEAATVQVAAGRISGNAQRGFDVLCQLKPDNAPAVMQEWMEGCRAFLGSKSVAQRFYDLKKVLLAKGYVLVNEQGLVTRRME